MAYNKVTRQKVVDAALLLFLKQGIKKTSLENVAYQAGITRVTIYRYFPDKQTLVEAALLAFPARLEELSLEPLPDLDKLAALLTDFPQGDLPALLEETRRLYPDLERRFEEWRLAAIQKIFERLFAAARARGELRPGLNPLIVQAFFITSVLNIMENPLLASSGLSAAEVFATVKAIFLHGIYKETVK